MRSKSCLRVVAAVLLACVACLITTDSTSAQVPPIQAGQVVISELRLRGPEGPRDEYVELYNNTDSTICVQATDTSGGWALVMSGTNAAGAPVSGPVFTIPNGTCIPARGHLLGANAAGYSLSPYPSGSAAPTATPSPTPFTQTTPDRTFDIDDIPDGFGVALFSTTAGPNQNAATRLDAFGFTSSPALFKEGNGFPTVPAVGTEHAIYRDLRPGGFHRDTNDNASDFMFVQTAGTIQPSVLGAPGPENLASPVVNNAVVGDLLDPSTSSTQSPNRLRNTQPVANGDFGTLVIRRRITNNTGLPVTRLRFRVVNITGPGTENTCGAVQCADVRVLSSTDGQASSPNIGTVVVRGVRLEEPPAQPNGGGFNSSVSADFITLTSPLAPGQSVNVQFTLGVMRTGSFRFILNIEALTGQPVIVLNRIEARR
jgi:hypothetical protein